MDFRCFTKAALFFTVSIISFGSLAAQETENPMQKKVKSQQYNFVPESFSSSTVNRQITTREFELRVTTDSVIAILPYFGTSYTAKFGRSDDNDITFASTNFKYSAVAKKKGKWEISIEPKDAKGVRLFLTVFNNNYAQMDVISPGKESVSFKGYIW